ncbi:MAG TPA: enoyl-CoA hydratase [Cerasibacillus sp.]|uniref:enoyl-CoA hydratase n=1 Tax=Cerasibacillus sp. TaxID=2498711 RepID=UPI002F424382
MEKVKLVRENGVSTIMLNRPDSYNAIDVETMEQLLEKIEQVEKNDDNIVIMTGAGKAFSSGGDIAMMKQLHDATQFKNVMLTLEAIALKLYMLPKITIAAVNGSAVGLGLSLALNSDYIVAHQEAKFGMLFAGIALIPDGGGHFFLKERLGVHQAKQFIWSLKQVSGETAKNIGFVEILTDQDAQLGAKHLATQLQAAPLQAIIESKIIYHEEKKDELRHFLEREKQGQLKMRSTEDHQEGVRAFLEKRKPVFKGK